MSLGDFASAAQMRDIVARLVSTELERLRPAYLYATVDSIDVDNRVCYVIYPGEEEPVPIPFGAIQPSRVGQQVRIDGLPGDRHVEDAIGGARITDVVVVPPPANLSYSTSAPYTYPQIDLNWQAPTAEDPSAYQVRFRPTASVLWEIRFLQAPTTSITLYPLAKDTQYTIEVTTVARNGALSQPVTITVTTGHDTTPPGAVAGLSATGGFGTVDLEWTENAEPDMIHGAGTYRIQMAVGSGFGTVVRDWIVSGTKSQVINLVDSTQYAFRVYARDADGNQSTTASSVALATTLSLDPTQIPMIPTSRVRDGLNPPGSPTPVVSAGIGYLFATWAAISNADSVVYEVHLDTTSGFTPSSLTKVTETSSLYALIRTLPGTSTPLSYGTTYYVKLIAKDIDGAAAAGSQDSGVPLQATAADIAQPTFVAITGGDFLNSWGNSGGSDGVAGYYVDVQGFVHLFGTIVGGTIGASFFQFPVGLRPADGKTHHYPAMAAGNFSGVDVYADGNVHVGVLGSPAAGSNVCLDGITFLSA